MKNSFPLGHYYKMKGVFDSKAKVRSELHLTGWKRISDQEWAQALVTTNSYAKWDAFFRVLN